MPDPSRTSGRHLDALVAALVFREMVTWLPTAFLPEAPHVTSSTTRGGYMEVPRYSSDLTAAWLIVLYLRPFHFDLRRLNDGWYCRLCRGDDNSRDFHAYGGRTLDPADAALAICRAALAAVEGT